MKRMRRIIRETKQRQAAKERPKSTPIKPLEHAKQYSHVQSKVKQKLDEVNNRITLITRRINHR